MCKMYIEKQRIQSAYRLRQIRESASLTQEQFAETLGISVSAYKKVESGENHISMSSEQFTEDKKILQQIEDLQKYILLYLSHHNKKYKKELFSHDKYNTRYEVSSIPHKVR